MSIEMSPWDKTDDAAWLQTDASGAYPCWVRVHGTAYWCAHCPSTPIAVVWSTSPYIHEDGCLVPLAEACAEAARGG